MYAMELPSDTRRSGGVAGANNAAAMEFVPRTDAGPRPSQTGRQNPHCRIRAVPKEQFTFASGPITRAAGPGMTGGAVAELMGTTQAVVARLERDRVEPSSEA
jgi:hypothetical protein